jgi:hypothetical protein
MNETVQLSPGVILRCEKFGGLAITPGNDNLYVLNRVGLRILEFCRPGSEIGKVVAHIEETYRIPTSVAERDVVAFVKNSTQKTLTCSSPQKT